MAENINRLPAFQPPHPGAVLRDTILPAAGIPKATLAAHIGLSRQSLYQILNEQRGITADVAARLGRGFGNSSLFWLNLQTMHDAWEAEQSETVQAVTRLRA